MLIKTDTFTFDSEKEFTAEQILKNKKNGKTEVISSGSHARRIVWNRGEARKNETRFNFAVKELSDDNVFTRGNWVKLKIDGHELLGNINSISKRFNISKEIIKNSNEEELGGLLKMLAANLDAETSTINGDNGMTESEIGFVLFLVETYIDEIKKRLKTRDEQANLAYLRPNLICYFNNKFFADKKSDDVQKALTRFTGHKTEADFERDLIGRFLEVARLNLTPMIPNFDEGLFNEAQAKIEEFAKTNNVDRNLLGCRPVLRLFIYRLQEEKLKEQPQVLQTIPKPLFSRLANILMFKTRSAT